MKVLLLFGIILVYTSSQTEAYIGLIEQPEDPGHPGQCLDEGETYHAVGTTWKSGGCESSTCRRSGENKLEIKVTGCAPMAAPPECVPVPMDTSKPFPQCCPSFNCPK